MKRAIIYVGPAMSGKTRKANEIAETTGKDKTVFISARGNRIDNPFFFSECNEDTELVIIDDTNKDFNYYRFCYAVTDRLIVEKRGKNGFYIHPQLIFTSCFTPKEIGQLSFDGRFQVIQMPEGIELNPLP